MPFLYYYPVNYAISRYLLLLSCDEELLKDERAHEGRKVVFHGEMSFCVFVLFCFA